MPWYVTAFLKLLSPFIDPVTKTKMKYNEPLINHVPASQLLKASGGDVDFVYDHEVYWPALDQLASQRRKEQRERWEKAGNLIGESELYLKGGEEDSVGTKEKKEVEAVADAVAKVQVKDDETKEQAKTEAPKEEIKPLEEKKA